jgi:hypothetical protein
LSLIGYKLQALTEEQKKRAEEHTLVCAEKVGLDLEVASKIRYAIVDEDVMEQRCFSKCFLERSGFLDLEGNLQPDVVLEKLTLAIGSDEESVSMIKTLIDTCGSLSGDGECVTASMVHNCYWKNIKGGQ